MIDNYEFEIYYGEIEEPLYLKFIVIYQIYLFIVY